MILAERPDRLTIFQHHEVFLAKRSERAAAFVRNHGRYRDKLRLNPYDITFINFFT